MKKRCIALMLIAAMSINGMTALAVEKAESKDNSVSAAYVKTAVHEDGWYHDNTSNSWYYYVDGEYVTGWKHVDGYWYYFNASGVMQKGWKKVDGYWYYFNQNGCMITGWKNVEGYWYYFNQNGCMITGWKHVDGYWYYFNQNGCMITGWKNADGYWYYFNRAGVMQIGWEKVDGYWYYFNKAGVMQTSRWIDNTYYVNSNGVMLTNAVTPDGYWVGADGRYGKPVSNAFHRTIKTSWGTTLDYRVPHINMNTESVKRANNVLYNWGDEIYNCVLRGDLYGDSTGEVQVDYFYYTNKDVISVITWVDDGYGWLDFRVYNVRVSDNEIISNTILGNIKGYNSQELEKLYKKRIKEWFNDNKNGWGGFLNSAFLDKALSDENIRNIKPFISEYNHLSAIIRMYVPAGNGKLDYIFDLETGKYKVFTDYAYN